MEGVPWDGTHTKYMHLLSRFTQSPQSMMLTGVVARNRGTAAAAAATMDANTKDRMGVGASMLDGTTTKDALCHLTGRGTTALGNLPCTTGAHIVFDV